MIGVTILGSTGSVGVNTLAVMALHRGRYRAAALCANRNVEALFAQCLEWRPGLAVLRDPDAAETLHKRLREAGLGSEIEVLAGEDGLIEAAGLAAADQVMAAIVGAAGLRPTLAAAQAGKRVLLANKEALVLAGTPFMAAVRRHGATLLPIDSEHNALFQCLPPGFSSLTEAGVTRLLLTGSGGPFLHTPTAELAAVTPDQACAHPNWRMGRKISVDSATMMNKGLEVIEACRLFGAELDQVEVVIHPQSVIHSLVEYADGSLLAQLGQPDMRTPIAHAMAWPERLASGAERLALEQLTALQFKRPDLNQFPCLRLAREAHAAGGTATAVLNAANEEAVAAFLALRLGFSAIAGIIEQTLADTGHNGDDGLDSVLAADTEARRVARRLIELRAA